MKKKAIIIIIILILLILLIPRPIPFNDGGTVSYRAVLYEITIVRPFTGQKGIIIEILGLKIYDKMDYLD